MDVDGGGEAACQSWLELRFDQVPECLGLFSSSQQPGDNIFQTKRKKTNKELPKEENFFKGVKWSPDGACFVSSSEDTGLRVFDLPATILEQTEVLETTSPSTADSYDPAVIIWEGETVYDFCWYPHMLSTDPTTCCLATTSRAHPVHLWDAVTGEIRCTYRAYNNVDEITAAFSLAFNPVGDKIYCGYERMLRVFEISRPGREYKEHFTKPRVGGSVGEGQGSIISCLAFNPDAPSAMFAAGSYDRTTALYGEANCELLFVLHGQQGGVTQVQFSRDGNYLYTGGRKDPEILCWDVRNTAGVVYKLPRDATGTNQRIAFDIEPCGRHLASGGQDGCVRIYDLQTGTWVCGFQAATDTVNGFGFHPCLPLAVTSSGQRRFPLTAAPCDSSSSDEEDDADLERNATVAPGVTNRMGLWRFACTWASDLDLHVGRGSEEDNLEALAAESDAQEEATEKKQDVVAGIEAAPALGEWENIVPVEVPLDSVLASFMSQGGMQ